MCTYWLLAGSFVLDVAVSDTSGSVFAVEDGAKSREAEQALEQARIVTCHGFLWLEGRGNRIELVCSC